VRAILKFRLLVRFEQSQPGFVNESGRLKSMSVSFLRHFVSRQFPQLVIDNREQFIGRCSVAALKIVKDARHVTHGISLGPRLEKSNLRPPGHLPRFVAALVTANSIAGPFA
jgi:hypothetical protein